MSKEDFEHICAGLTQDRGSAPQEYESLSPTMKELLAYWMSKAMKPAPTYATESSYGLKHFFERQTGVYVGNGEFKGAMLMAGYLPKLASEKNWHFKITKTYDARKTPHDPFSQDQHRNQPYYRTQMNGEVEPELQRRIAEVRETASS